MANPFSKPEKSINSKLRNTFDLSFANNLTLDMGGLYPCFCKEVLPGDSFRINTTFGLRFMPTAFPLQSRLRADVHFFYVRNRNLWNGWQEFITNSPEAAVQKPFPTVDPKSIYYVNNRGDNLMQTGNLGDYLGLPTTLSGKYRNSAFIGTVNYDVESPDVRDCVLKYSSPVTFLSPSGVDSSFFGTVPGSMIGSGRPGLGRNDYVTFGSVIDLYGIDYGSILEAPTPSDRSNANCVFLTQPIEDGPFFPGLSLYHQKSHGFFATFRGQNSFTDLSCVLCMHLVDKEGFIRFTGYYIPPSVPGKSSDMTFFFPPDERTDVFEDVDDLMPIFSIHRQNSDTYSPTFDRDGSSWLTNTGDIVFHMSISEYDFSVAYPRDIADLLDTGNGFNPFESDIPVSALPFRAYESIYNAFYRDERNNPYMLNDTPVYNRYIPTTDGGTDSSHYQIRYRNWEQDFLTTALPSPQQGIAPLVGLTSTEAVFQDPETGRKFVAQPVFEDDGETLQTVRFNEDVPSSVARSLIEVASYGISINDFRNVNSLQRYLENNLRNGLKYVDVLRMRYGVNPSYSTLDMPEFIGGVSQPVNVTQINQMAPSDSDPLGSYAGQLNCVGSSKRSVNHYCDEHGFIIGILSVVPVPVYSTLLPKFFTKTQPLDYFTPEFSHIGLQPIPNREVAPLLIANDPDVVQSGVSKALAGTFGYQRPWYDYLASVDEVHGQFRTDLRDFLLHRVFDSPPVLDESFLTINPDTLTDVFTYGGSGHKILGQMYFDVKAKRPIPRSSVARLE